MRLRKKVACPLFCAACPLFLLLALASSCKKDERRYAVGPASIALPEGFIDDVSRADKLAGKGAVDSQGRVWVNKARKMQLALSLARLPHQEEWDKVSLQVLLLEMFAQEKEAGEKAGLRTVDWNKELKGDVLHYAIEGDMSGKLATSARTVLWLDRNGDCWHASAVCTAQPADRDQCKELMESVKFDLAAMLDAGAAK